MTFIKTQYSTYLSALVIFLFIVLPSSCTKVVDVDVPNGGERLIIEASLNWEKGTLGNEQTILLSLSTPFFEKNKFTPAQLAQVTVTNVLTQDAFTFTETSPGIYVTTQFIPVLNATYRLNVTYNGEQYSATETLKSVSEITHIEQGTESIFGEESIQISAFVQDPIHQENYYYVEFWDTENGEYSLIGREVESDELSDGNAINFEYDDENFESGRNLEIKAYGISEGYYNFINLLLEQSGGEGGPFSTIPAKLIGNCINETNPNKETLGYFRLSESSTYLYTIE